MMKKIDKILVKYCNHKVGVLSLTPDSRYCVFEYDAMWLVNGFSISPLELPLKSGIFVAKSVPFAGNFGVFEDSLPDGYGRYLLHKTLAREGIDDRSLSALDRLSLVGDGGMGALTYEPVSVMGDRNEISDFDVLQEKALEVLRERQDSDAGLLLYNSGNSGGARPKAVYSDGSGHWLVKFRHTYDPLDIGLQEYRYNEIAKKCGINVPEFKLVNGKYFATRRFDIGSDGKRKHVVTVGGLLGVSLSEPVLDYSNLLSLTGFLTQSVDEVEEMYRRMVFNYLMDNKDDHCKNFSFIVDKDLTGGWRWRLAPAYDLTRCSGGYNGEHATSVNWKGRPCLADFIAVGRKIKLSEQRCRDIIFLIKDACGNAIKYDIE
jgi:serine/threonine-protein kinase HipA